jgi:hypothetical protein
MKRIFLMAVLTGSCGFFAAANAQSASNTTNTNSVPGATFSAPGGSSGLSCDYVHKIGLGVTLGEPTGGSIKYWLNDTMAIDGAAGWSSHDHTDFYMHGDLLWHNFDLIPVPRGRMPVYIGVGGLVRFRNDGYDNQVGIRLPLGVDYMFENTPVDVFAEVAPAMDVSPDVRGDFTGGVGIRFWF